MMLDRFWFPGRRATTKGEGLGWIGLSLVLTVVLSFIVIVLGEVASTYPECLEVPAFSMSVCLIGYPYRDIGVQATTGGGIIFVVGLVLLGVWAAVRARNAAGQ